MPSGNPANLVPFEKGKRHAGRAVGTPNVFTRVLKRVIVMAGEQSRHSKDGSLLSYLVHVANEHPALYINLLGRLVPIEGRLKTEFERPQQLDPSMNLPEMIAAFEAKLKNPDYQPKQRAFDHNDDSDDDETKQ